MTSVTVPAGALNTISEPRRSASGATRDGLLYL